MCVSLQLAGNTTLFLLLSVAIQLPGTEQELNECLLSDDLLRTSDSLRGHSIGVHATQWQVGVQDLVNRTLLAQRLQPEVAPPPKKLAASGVASDPPMRLDM